ncbi:MAG: helix-turn-helix domain-containing protein [Chloroflexi bacterium]|nr:MAG: helix-turn-helix domain-containing protein [Chloroflexota bacterium]
MSDIDQALGPTLKRLRHGAGMTQEELAERAGISARTVSDVERGLRTLVHQDTARRLISALGLSEEQGRRFGVLARGDEHEQAPAATTAGLPTVLTPFLGRSKELEAIQAALLGGDVRLLTLTGPGGIGKTRLAMEVARGIESSWPDGVLFISLGELKDASLVAPELAKAVGAVESDSGLQDVLIRRLSGRKALIVLDTFEHLTAAAPLVYALALGCPKTTFLVTSRSALRLRGEREFPVPPLESPPDTGGDPLLDASRWPATALFWDRVRAVRPDLEMDRSNALLVTDICRRLDGLPLAIELAAARVKHLSLGAIRDQLEHRLELLVGGPLDLPVRQRAIRDTVAWSHDLLDGRAKTLLRRLSVFAGGWALADIEGVCGPAAEIGGALEGVSALVDQSLVVVDRKGSEGRFDMLDVVREYAAQRLTEAGEREEIARRHALYYLEMAEDAEPRLVRAGHMLWFHRLAAERGNLRAGMALAVDHGETVMALRYGVALWRYWRHFGEFAEGRRWLDMALAVPGQAPPSLRAKALWAASALAFPQGDHERMAVLASEAYELALQGEDRMDLRNALTSKGLVAMVRAQYQQALPSLREAVAICQSLGLSWQLGTSYLNLGTALLHAGFGEEAVSTLQEGLRVYRELGDDVFAARITNTMAHAALARGDIEEADRLARKALTSAAEQGERQGIGDGLHALAAVAAARADPDRAARLAGASSAVREMIAARPGPFDVAIPKRFIEISEQAVGAKRWHRSWQAGHAMSVVAAVAYGLA